MSYCIRYGKECPPEMRWKQRKHRISVGAIVGLVVAAAAVLIPQVREGIRLLLAPWLDDTTAAAFSNLLGAVGCGEAVPVAFLDFCREILSNAQIPV